MYIVHPDLIYRASISDYDTEYKNEWKQLTRINGGRKNGRAVMANNAVMIFSIK